MDIYCPLCAWVKKEGSSPNRVEGARKLPRDSRESPSEFLRHWSHLGQRSSGDLAGRGLPVIFFGALKTVKKPHREMLSYTPTGSSKRNSYCLLEFIQG